MLHHFGVRTGRVSINRLVELVSITGGSRVRNVPAGEPTSRHRARFKLRVLKELADVVEPGIGDLGRIQSLDDLTRIQP